MVGPDPEGEIPDGWSLEEWETYQILAGDPDQTYASAAKQLGCSSSTVSRRIRGLRDRYGPDIYVSPRAGKLNVTPEQALEGAHNGGAVIAARWAERRLDVGEELGTTAKLANSVATAGLEILFANRDRLAGLTTKDFLNLARFADLAAKRADVLTDSVPGGPPADPLEGGYGVDLSGLESAAAGDRYQETYEAVEIIYRQYRQQTGRDVVDLAEA